MKRIYVGDGDQSELARQLLVAADKHGGTVNTISEGGAGFEVDEETYKAWAKEHPKEAKKAAAAGGQDTGAAAAGGAAPSGVPGDGAAGAAGARPGRQTTGDAAPSPETTDESDKSDLSKPLDRPDKTDPESKSPRKSTPRK